MTLRDRPVDLAVDEQRIQERPAVLDDHDFATRTAAALGIHLDDGACTAPENASRAGRRAVAVRPGSTCAIASNVTPRSGTPRTRTAPLEQQVLLGALGGSRPCRDLAPEHVGGGGDATRERHRAAAGERAAAWRRERGFDAGDHHALHGHRHVVGDELREHRGVSLCMGRRSAGT